MSCRSKRPRGDSPRALLGQTGGKEPLSLLGGPPCLGGTWKIGCPPPRLNPAFAELVLSSQTQQQQQQQPSDGVTPGHGFFPPPLLACRKRPHPLSCPLALLLHSRMERRPPSFQNGNSPSHLHVSHPTPLGPGERAPQTLAVSG